MVSRLERTPFAAWWWTIDRLLLAALLALMLGGIVLSLAASPPVASRLGLEPFYFVSRHVLYLIPALAVLLGVSFLPPRYVRRLALIVFVVSVLMVLGTLHFGAEVKGARRWIVLLGVNIQPSEFLKPAFVILIAWLFGESARRPEMPANTMALGLLLVAVTGLVMQPDFGQTMLVSLVWGALFFLAGMRIVWVVGLGGVAAVGLATAYMTVPLRGAAHRAVPRSRRPATPSTSTRRSNPSSSGGWFGRGPGRGHRQAHPARKPHRFRVRGRGRGIRDRAVPGAGRGVRFHRAAHACATPCAAKTRSHASRPRALPSCSGCNRPSTWR